MYFRPVVRCLAVLAVVIPTIAGCTTSSAPLAWSPTELSVSSAPAAEPFAQLATCHFKLLYAADAAWVARMGQLLETAHGEFYSSLQRLGIQPQPLNESLVWVCFSRRDDFETYGRQVPHADLSVIDGCYSVRTNRVTVIELGDRAPGPARNPQAVLINDSAELPAFRSSAGALAAGIDVTRTTHEAAHQLAFNSGLQKRDVLYPLWVSEGLATNFEADSSGALGFGRDNPDRRRGLLMAHAGGRLLPLADMIVLTRAPPGAGRDVRDIYAESWGLFHFFLSRHGAQFKQYLQTLARLDAGNRSPQTLRAEFVAAFGPVEKLDREWSAYLASLPTDRQIDVYP